MNSKSNQQLLKEYSKYLAPVVDFLDKVIIKGEGSYVWDADGEKILDLNSGQFCAIFGHSNPQVGEVLNKISTTIQETNTAALNEDILIAAKKVHDICEGMNGRTIFLSTGAEANECCLRYAKHLSGNKQGVITFDKAWHGLSHGTEGYSMSRKHVKPPLAHSYYVEVPKAYGEKTLTMDEIEVYIKQFEKIVSENSDNIAVALFEPIVSSGGMYIPPKYYFKRIREICNKYGVFLAFDEAQTGFGRTGTWFYYQQLECIPDFLICSKGIGLGYPISAVVFNGNSIKNEKFLMKQYSSHQNDPFAGALVSFGIDKIEKENILERNKEMGEYLVGKLTEVSSKYSYIKNPRGKGLMCAFDLNVKDINNSLMEGKVFCNRALQYNIMLQECNSGNTIRILPNYYVRKEEVEFLCTNLKKLLEKFYSYE